jgi:hypothetical protein
MRKAQILGVVALGLVACGGAQNTVKTVDDAKAIMAAIKAAGARVAGQLNVDIACPEGGVVRAEGQAAVAGTSGSAKAKSYFRACVANGIKLDGTLDEEVTTSVDAATQAIQITGRDNGSIDTPLGMCVLSLTQSIAVSGVTPSTTSSGQICGFESKSVLGA